VRIGERERVGGLRGSLLNGDGPLVRLVALPDHHHEASLARECRADIAEGGDRSGEEHRAEPADRDVKVRRRKGVDLRVGVVQFAERVKGSDKLMHMKVDIGEEVFTAGIELQGGIRSPYPKGLLIGRVGDVTRDPNEVVQKVFLEPAAPLDRLEFLLVITDYEGGITGPIETGVPCDPTKGGTLPDSDQPCASDAPRSPAPGR